MRYLDERVWVILNELRPLIDRQHIDITKWKIKKKLFMRPCEADIGRSCSYYELRCICTVSSK